jgi:ribosome-binding factor A
MSNQSYSRTDRVSQQLKEFLATKILKDLTDPRVQNVEITGVDVTQDCKRATVFYVILDEDGQNPDVHEGLESAADYLKYQIGEELHLKFVPELFFEYDDSFERARKIDSLLDGIDT